MQKLQPSIPGPDSLESRPPMSAPPKEFNDDHIPMGSLITFRAYGTWLHGDERGSVDRFHRTYGTPMLPPNLQRTNYERRLREQHPVKLDSRKRDAIESGIRETCAIATGCSGLSTSYKPCSYGRIGELQTRTDLERAKGKRNALDERSGMLEKRS